MFLIFLIPIIIGAITIIFWDKIIYIKKPIKKLYGEITYDNPSKIILYDFSKYDKEGIVGMIYHSDIEYLKMYNDILNGVYLSLANDYPNYPKDYIMNIAAEKVIVPHFYIMNNATLLINRFNGKRLIEGDIENWTQ